MLTFLTSVSHFMGMINVRSRLTNRIYTIVAFVGNWYLLYIAIRFLQNGRYLRGLGILAVFLVFLYFLIMNIFYFFTNRRAPLDISPYIEKMVGGRPEEIREREEMRQRLSRVERQAGISTQSNGHFAAETILPARLQSNATQKANIQTVVDQMQRSGLLLNDYHGMSDAQITQALNANKTEVFAIGDGVDLPYFELRLVNNHPMVYAGLNNLESYEIGEVIRVGLSDFKSANQEYQLSLATAKVTGGEKKVLGRSNLYTENENYTIQIKMAYKVRK